MTEWDDSVIPGSRLLCSPLMAPVTPLAYGNLLENICWVWHAGDRAAASCQLFFSVLLRTAKRLSAQVVRKGRLAARPTPFWCVPTASVRCVHVPLCCAAAAARWCHFPVVSGNNATHNEKTAGWWCRWHVGIGSCSSAIYSEMCAVRKAQGGVLWSSSSLFFPRQINWKAKRWTGPNRGLLHASSQHVTRCGCLPSLAQSTEKWRAQREASKLPTLLRASQ